jgi:hypothetical protein
LQGSEPLNGLSLRKRGLLMSVDSALAVFIKTFPGVQLSPEFMKFMKDYAETLGPDHLYKSMKIICKRAPTPDDVVRGLKGHFSRCLDNRGALDNPKDPKVRVLSIFLNAFPEAEVTPDLLSFLETYIEKLGVDHLNKGMQRVCKAAPTAGEALEELQRHFARWYETKEKLSYIREKSAKAKSEKESQQERVSVASTRVSKPPIWKLNASDVQFLRSCGITGTIKSDA